MTISLHPSSTHIDDSITSSAFTLCCSDKMSFVKESMNRKSPVSKDRKRKTEMTVNHDNTNIDDKVVLHRSEERSHPRMRNSMGNGDGRVKTSTATARPTNNHLKHPPPVQRTVQRHTTTVTNNAQLRGFDPSSLLWLQNMEEIATVWLNMLVQQQHLYRQYQDNHSQEKQRIIDFCTRTLQQILSEGGFRSYTTPSYPPSLYSQPLPPLQDLPCMVVTLKYWYSTLLSRCQHQTAVRMLPHRVLAPQQLSQISVPDYIRACEDEVKRWLRDFVNAESKSKFPSSDVGMPSDNPAQVAVWMQQLRAKTVPTYSPSKSKSTVATQESHSPNQKAKESRIPSPTEVMMFDSAVAAILNPEDCNESENEDDMKPAAKKSPPFVSTSKSGMFSPNARRSVLISEEKANRMSGLILSLYHANKCPFNDSDDSIHCCPISKGCHKVKDLWNHITLNPNRTCCAQNTCSFARLASVAEEALTHYGVCKKPTCQICGPVLEHMPKVKHDIAAAVEASQRQAVAVEDAILQVVNDISNELSYRRATTGSKQRKGKFANNLDDDDDDDDNDKNEANDEWDTKDNPKRIAAATSSTSTIVGTLEDGTDPNGTVERMEEEVDHNVNDDDHTSSDSCNQQVLEKCAV